MSKFEEPPRGENADVEAGSLAEKSGNAENGERFVDKKISEYFNYKNSFVGRHEVGARVLGYEVAGAVLGGATGSVFGASEIGMLLGVVAAGGAVEEWLKKDTAKANRMNKLLGRNLAFRKHMEEKDKKDE